MTEGSIEQVKKYQDMVSRPNVIKAPHMMALLGYLQNEHSLPKYGWRNDRLRYHYTDAAGLRGMIENSRLWATDIRFLNDPSEGSFLPERILGLMASKVGGTSKIEQEIIKGVRDALSSPQWKHTTYCISLSGDGDLLSQWRGYGGFGKGYAVGFRLGSGLPHPQIANYYDVVYGDEGLEKLASDLLDIFASSFEQWKDMMYDEWASTLTVLAKSFKDESYREERESRLVCTLSEEDGIDFSKELPLRFRSRGSEIVPYVDMSLDLLRDNDKPRLPIERIVIGPGVEFDRNHASISAMLRKNSYEGVEVVPSKIPFRP